MMSDEDTPGVGHNSGFDSDSADRLRNFVDRILSLEEEKKALADDIKDVKAEAKSAGFDTKILNKIVTAMKKERDDFVEEHTLTDLYLRAVGLLD